MSLKQFPARRCVSLTSGTRLKTWLLSTLLKLPVPRKVQAAPVVAMRPTIINPGSLHELSRHYKPVITLGLRCSFRSERSLMTGIKPVCDMSANILKNAPVRSFMEIILFDVGPDMSLVFCAFAVLRCKAERLTGVSW